MVLVSPLLPSLASLLPRDSSQSSAVAILAKSGKVAGESHHWWLGDGDAVERTGVERGKCIWGSGRKGEVSEPPGLLATGLGPGWAESDTCCEREE